MALQIWLPLDGDMKNKGLSQGHTITNNGGEPVFDVGNVGKGLVCNGSKNWKISGVTLGSEVTIAWWSKTTANAKMPWVLECPTSPYLNFYEATIYTLNTGDGNNNPFQTTANANINVIHDGKWHHFVNVFDGTKASLYIDGEYRGKAKTYKSPECTDRILKLAGDFNGGHSYDWNGMLQDFRVYDNVMSEEDIQDLYRACAYNFSPLWRHSGGLVQFGDASGTEPLISQTGHGLTVSGSSLYFDGSSSYIEFPGLKMMSGGSVSIWASLPAKPTSQRIYYCDPSSKMIVGYLAGGTILTSANSSSLPSYQSTGITWGKMHHIVAVWGDDRHPSALYVNGVAAATGGSSNWTNSGEIASIGRRIGTGSADYLQGCVNDVRVYGTKLTAADAMSIYKAGPYEENSSDGKTWVRILHHNNPAVNLFTTANCWDNDDENLYSKLRVLRDDNGSLKTSAGYYEFMVKERLTSTSAEQTYVWRQTSNPTASTCTGYQLVSQTNNPNRNFGISFGPTGNCLFSNKTAWWCACGCWTAYQGGIPGFNNVVTSGYMDLYINADMIGPEI